MRYFFDFRVEGRFYHDHVGVELESLEQAKREAIRALTAVAYDEAGNEGDQRFSIEVRAGQQRVFAAQLTIATAEGLGGEAVAGPMLRASPASE